MLLIDAHCDSPSQMMRLRDFSLDNDWGQVDFPKMRKGGVDASFFAAYVPSSKQGSEATQHAIALLDVLDKQMSSPDARAAYARCASGVRRNKAAGLTSVLIGLENASAIEESFELLKYFYKRGVRYITLTHSADNQVCDSCTGNNSWGGLSPFGKELIPEMNKIGMMIDLAHSSDATMWDVLNLSRKPVAYTHGCCRALASHKRNISDDLLRALADNGGVACMSIYPCFLDDEFVKLLDESGLEEQMWIEDEFIKDPSDVRKRSAWIELQQELNSLKRPGISRVADHIEHAIAVAGVEHVGIGTDYDGIEVTAEGLENISLFPSLWTELKKRGLSQKELNLIAGGNLLRVLKEVRKR